jgi:ADP-heptose:LPS heptosyltransferase
MDRNLLRCLERPRILITRLSHIGDCVLTIPLLIAIREALPHAFIAWAVEKPSDQLLKGLTQLDQVIVVPKGWLKSPRKTLSLRRQLQSLRFNLAIDPQSLTKSSMLAWLSGANWRIGFGDKHGRETARFLNQPRVKATKPHLVDRTLELLKPLGIDPTEVRFELPVTTANRQTVQDFVHTQQIEPGYALINPGCGWASRRWEMKRYGQVAQLIGSQYGLGCVVAWAGDKERLMAEAIVADSAGQAILAPPTSLLELAALSEQARFYLGSDTGPAHIAAAMGTACIGLFGSTLPQMSGPYGDGHVHVQACYQSGTSRQRRKAENSAMKEITVAHVCQAIDQLLNHPASCSMILPEPSQSRIRAA